MRKLFLVLMVVFLCSCTQPKDHSYVYVEPLIVIPSTTTTVPIPPSTTSTTQHVKKTTTVVAKHKTSAGIPGVCGGVLPPCWVLDRESGYSDGDPNTYDIHASNPGGCSGNGCTGKWQCDPGTCDGTGTEEQQNAEAARVWDNGRGCSHWNAC